MHAALIPEKSGAPTVRERAAAHWKASAEQRELRRVEEVRIAREQASAVLIARLSACLGITIAEEDVIYYDVSNLIQTSLAYALIDGVAFRVVDSEILADERNLCVGVECAACHQPLWLPIDEGDSAWVVLHEILSEPAHYHPLCHPNETQFALLPTEDRSWRVTSALRAIEGAGERLAQAVRQIQELEDGRASEKSAAIRRLMQTMNEETGKAHSASSADKVVELDAEYSAYRRRQADAEVEKHRAFAAYDVAKRTADLELELFRSAERNQ